ncbi:MAG: LexA family protein [Leptonema sp. (in: bacteria)]
MRNHYFREGKGKNTIFTLNEELYNKLIPIVYTGFPSPAEDYVEKRIDLNEILVSNPKSTFFMKVQGYSYNGLIQNNDILIIDCSLSPKNENIIVIVNEGEFLIKKFIKKNDSYYLLNLKTQNVEIIDNSIEIWGVVTYVIHSTRR